MPLAGALYADFSYSKPTPAAALAAGYSGVVGYLSTPDNSSKNISGAQMAGYQSAGLDVLLVWETTAQRALGGSAAGSADGTAAFGQARERGFPLTSALFFNIGDFAASPGQIPAISQYLAAVIATCPAQLVGAYGTGYIIDQLAASYFGLVWWQNAMNDSGEKGNVVSANANLYQRVTPTHPIPGYSIDENVVTKAWSVNNPLPPPITYPVGSYMQTQLTIPTDSNGNGWAQTTIPWPVVAVFHEGSDPGVDNAYWPGSAHVQDRGNCALVSVTGCLPLSNQIVFVTS
jgi:Domain of unknown function (DUF1906)